MNFAASPVPHPAIRPASAVSRRSFLHAATTTAATAAFACDLESVAAASATHATPAGYGRLVDVNVTLDRWPMRRWAADDTPALVGRLRRRGVVQAWAGSFDGLLHKDLGSVNARLAAECRRFGRGLLLPFGSVNPRLPDYEEEVRRCAEVHRMPGIRLYPNYHGYRLDDPGFRRLLRLAVEHRLIVQLALVMEDERMMHPLLRVEPVDTAPLAGVVREVPGLRLVLLNALRTVRGAALDTLLSSGDVSVEISMIEGVGGVGTLLAQVPASRVLFGSHTPLFYFESALLKLAESALAGAPLAAVARDNARRLLGRRF